MLSSGPAPLVLLLHLLEGHLRPGLLVQPALLLLPLLAAHDLLQDPGLLFHLLLLPAGPQGTPTALQPRETTLRDFSQNTTFFSNFIQSKTRRNPSVSCSLVPSCTVLNIWFLIGYGFLRL